MIMKGWPLITHPRAMDCCFFTPLLFHLHHLHMHLDYNKLSQVSTPVNPHQRYDLAEVIFYSWCGQRLLWWTAHPGLSTQPKQGLWSHRVTYYTILINSSCSCIFNDLCLASIIAWELRHCCSHSICDSENGKRLNIWEEWPNPASFAICNHTELQGPNAYHESHT